MENLLKIGVSGVPSGGPAGAVRGSVRGLWQGLAGAVEGVRSWAPQEARGRRFSLPIGDGKGEREDAAQGVPGRPGRRLRQGLRSVFNGKVRGVRQASVPGSRRKPLGTREAGQGGLGRERAETPPWAPWGRRGRRFRLGQAGLGTGRGQLCAECPVYATIRGYPVFELPANFAALIK